MKQDSKFSPAQKALLAKRLRGQHASDRTFNIPRRRVEGPVAPSFTQERFWFLDQLDPESTVYNRPVAMRLNGELDVKSLEGALSEIVRRHEVLRTSFPTTSGRPTQVISPAYAINLPVTDLTHLPKSDREASAIEHIVHESQHPFDLAQGPLLRASLLRLKSDEHVLLLAMHHVVFDRWSVQLLYHELSELYAAFVNESPSPLPEPPIQYADFAIWQRERLQGNKLEQLLAYWKQQLVNHPAALELPLDRPRPSVQSERGAHVVRLLPEHLLQALKSFSRGENVTLFMTLLAAFKTLLHRYSGQDDIVVGSPIANRTRVELEGLIGCFINTLALRSDLSGDPTFREMLQRIRQTTLAAYEHQDLPFEKLVEELQPERDLSRNPIFQVMFILQNTPTSHVDMSRLSISRIDVHSGTEKYDITLEVEETDQGLRAALSYNTDLFNADTIERMLRHYQLILEGIVANPEQRISRLPILTESEYHQVLIDWNDTQADYPTNVCIHHLFEAQVVSTPEALALVAPAEDVQLSYDELNRRANQLAHYLRGRGVVPETKVGICAERSVDLFVGILGVLKAGGAYVPIDAKHPQERMAFILEDAQSSILLTQQRLVDRLPQHLEQAICLDTDWHEIAQERDDNPQHTSTSDSLAYVIYTSGTTGKPKGVLISHRPLVNHGTAFARQYELRPSDRVLQFHAPGFDVLGEEIYPTWLSGGSIVLRTDQVIESFEVFTQFVEQQHISVVNLPSPFWHTWVTELSRLPTQLPECLRLVIAGSDKTLREQYETWQALVGDRVKWLTAYGPTEATITTTVFEPDPSHALGVSGSMPIGRPIANTQIYILDAHLQPVPIGVRGELHIGGDCLARGYLNRPELTKEKFIPDPFSTDINARLYKTGDVARYLPDGNIEFLGRVDHQVKIRGMRIELGEIEYALSQHPRVHQNVVTAREDKAGDKRLTAYIITDRQPALSTNELRRHLGERLPDYMLPSAFVMLDELPLMPNGKVDRRALPKPDSTRSDLDESFISPQTETERELSRIWEQLLEIRPIGAKDSFFDLGGHSLLAIRMAARIEESFGANIPLISLFKFPTVFQLAEMIDQQSTPAEWPPLVPIQPEGSKPPFFCVHPLCGDVVGFGVWSEHMGSDQPFYGLRARGLDGVQEPYTEVTAIATDYIQQIRTVQPSGPYHLGGYGPGSILVYEMAQQLQAQGETVNLLALINQSPPNSGYYDIDWGAGFIVNFLRNLPHWLKEYMRLKIAKGVYRILLQLRPGGLLDRIQQKIPLLKNMKHLEDRGRVFIDEHDQALLDYDNVPQVYDDRQRKIGDIHWRAISSYMPQTYRGTVIVLRTRRQPLLCSFDPQLKWGELVDGSVEVKVIPGSNSTILKEPHAISVAAALKDSLDKAQTRIS